MSKNTNENKKFTKFVERKNALESSLENWNKKNMLL